MVMSPDRGEGETTDPKELQAQLHDLEEAYATALRKLEDFDAEREKLRSLQRATVNLLEDMDDERRRSFGTQRALLNMLEDIDEERSKVEHTKSVLESVNNELEAFSYSVSHDLRAPLRAISGFSQAVLEDYAPLLDDEGKRYLGLIQDNANRMGQLIDDLLTFSRLGRQSMSEAEIDMDALARSVFEELAAQEEGRRIDWTTLPVPPARGDLAMVRQVMVNLLSNAIKFTRTREVAIIEFGYETDAEGSYYVKDNGVGFDMQYMNKLFGVFQRLHSVTEFEGTGVGLALVNRIITRHGGRVWAEGQVGQGATFHFTLSRKDRHE
jgi:two-component system sensor kinase